MSEATTQRVRPFRDRDPEHYERALVPAVFAPWAEVLVLLANLQPGDRVLDLACGTGIVARTAAKRETPWTLWGSTWSLACWAWPG